MRNILHLAHCDLRRVFSTVMSAIIAIGLVVMPSIFAWYNILACWDVFDNTGNLKVAVASDDAGYESDLVAIRVNIGDEVMSALRANDQIDWVFTTTDDAIDGAKGGRYYAAVIIPEDFSRDMLTFYADGGKRAEVFYYANEKKNAIAPKVTGQGADAISYQINQVFAEKVSEIALAVASSLARYADDSGLRANMANVSARIVDLSGDAKNAASALRLFGQLIDTSAGLAPHTGQLIAGVQESLREVDDAAAPGVEALKQCAGTLRSSVKSMNVHMKQAAQSLANVQASLDSALDDASGDARAVAADMRREATHLRAQADALNVAANQLEAAAAGLPDEAAADVRAAANMLRSAAALIQDGAANLTEAAGQLETGVADVAAKRQETAAMLANVTGKLREAERRFQDDVVPVAEKVASHCEALAALVNSQISGLAGADGAADAGPIATMTRAATTLSDASSSMEQVADQFDVAADELSSLARDIDAALVANDVEALRELMTSDIQTISTALSAPVKLEREVVFPVANFGSAMTPLYAVIALFIGALLIMVALRPQVGEDEMDEVREVVSGRNLKPYQVFFGRFVLVAAISLAQTTLMALGNMFFLQVQVDHPWLFMLCYWVAGLVFSFIIYALVQAFANLGKAIAVIMLIIQVTGCGGSYPLQILPEFVQRLSPWLPATYVVDAMRSAMFGVFENDFWVALGMLLLFLIPAALIGLVLRRPLAKLMGWYLGRVEESKLMA